MNFLTKKIPNSCGVTLLGTDDAEASTSGLGVMGKKKTIQLFATSVSSVGKTWVQRSTNRRYIKS
jgi:hypothetical protein